MERIDATNQYRWADGTTIRPKNAEGYEVFDEDFDHDKAKKVMSPDSQFNCAFMWSDGTWGVDKCNSNVHYVLCKL